MSLNRVQKLLFSEYCDFEDMVLIESPFAQTTREGTGIRQVHLGLTPSKLVLATDVLPPVDKTCVTYLPGMDPLIETFELIAIYPVECVNLSIFRQKQRQTIKAHFCNNRILFFELGGFEKRHMFWNLWRERVKFLSPEDPGSSHSETSVATSSSTSTLYLVNSRQVVHPNGLRQLWCRFATGNAQSDNVHKWTDRHLYMGRGLEDAADSYKPLVLFPAAGDFLVPAQLPVGAEQSRYSLTSNLESSQKGTSIGDSTMINRFGTGVSDGCMTGLFLPTGKGTTFMSKSYRMNQSSQDLLESTKYIDYDELAESSVRLWEIYKETDPNLYNTRHKRRYGFAPQPLFLHGLGPWNVSAGARFSIQVKRAVSMVSIIRQCGDEKLRLPISKRQLIATISSETLNINYSSKASNVTSGAKGPVVLFWTPDYWYRPRTARDTYSELQDHLNRVREYRERTKDGKTRKTIFRKKYKKEKEMVNESESHDSDEANGSTGHSKKRRSVMFKMFGTNAETLNDQESGGERREGPLQRMRRLLKMTVVLTAWDFDSTTIAQQLTMVDRDLLLKVTGGELAVLTWQQSSKNAPNVSALVAFSHRIGCLVATEILREDSEKLRARLIARFVNTADKCHRMANFQSTRSILSGLQSPSVYRLRATWAYVRKKHATKYQMFEHLSRIYRDPRLSTYQKSFFVSSQSAPFMPYIGDVIIKLLDRLPEYKVALLRKPSLLPVGSSVSSSVKSKSESDLQSPTNIVSKLLKNLKIWRPGETPTADGTKKRAKSRKPVRRKASTAVRSLHNYYKPLHVIEDNRARCLGETVAFLERCQLGAMTYVFGRNELCKDYLLKSRYREDKENFFKSISLEPPVEYNWQQTYNKV